MSTPLERTRLYRQRKAARALGLPAEPDGRTRPDRIWNRAHEADPAWRLEAKCRNMSPAVFFGLDRGDNHVDHASKHLHVAYAKAVCADCPSVAPCLEYALNLGPVAGVWGATSEQERRRLRRGRGRG